MSAVAVAAVLVLHPVLADDGWLRLVAAGTDGDVAWSVDGVEVARTADREATLVHVPAGEHVVEARAMAAGRWHVLARLEAPATGAAFVPAWSATHAPALDPVPHDVPATDAAPPLLALALGAAAALAFVWPDRARRVRGERRRLDGRSALRGTKTP